MNSNEKCNHDFKDSNTSLELILKKNMVYPSEKFYVCKYCHKVIKIKG